MGKQEDNIVESVETGEVSEAHINERRLLMRIDLRLLPCLVTMYLITFLDRVNIGNAAVLGMREDLAMVDGTKYNAALMIFFIPYVVFEIPANLFLVKLKPHVWLSFCALSFGLVTIFQGLVKSWASLMVTRWFLGTFEAGMIPGCVYMLSMWYRRYEAQKRYAIFGCSTILAGAFGGLLASALGKMDGVGGYGGWRWVFIIEGAATCLMAVVVFFALPDFPEDCKWVSQREFEFLRDRAARENGSLSVSGRTRWRDVLQVFRDWKIFIAALMMFGQIVSGYGYAYFAPTIIRTYGYGPIKTQLYSVPPWAASFGCSLVVAWLSDYFRHRYAFALISVLIAISGYCILLTLRETVHHNVQYFALFLVNCGCFSATPVYLCWFGMNLGGRTRRSVGTAFQVGIGNIGGIVGTYSFLEKDAPLYRNGYIIGLSFACFSGAMATIYFLGLWYENRQRERMLAEGVEVAAEEEEKLGDLACTYRYAY